MKFLYKQTTNKKQYSSQRRSLDSIKWIVIHYTGNYSKGANAEAHYRYLNNATRYGSAHFYVDDKEIIQTIGDSYTAWSVGDNQGHGRYLNGCNNSNSISIEFCVNSDSNQDLTYKNVLELTKNLMKKFNIPADKVCRHYDVSKKDCPHNFRANNWQMWWKFKEQIKEPIEWVIDMDKDSTFGVNNGVNLPPTVVTDVENLKEQDEARLKYLENINKVPEWAEKEWQEAIDLKITDGTRPGANASRVEVAVMNLRTLKQIRENK